MAKVFVIEDDPDVRSGLTTLLERAGHSVVCATDFGSLSDDVAKASPDLVLLDLGLPGTDGQYVARGIRQSSDVPIIVLTSRTGDLDELMSMTMGADAFIAKPYNGQVLLAHIDAVLRRAGAAKTRTLEWRGLSLDPSRSQASYKGKSVDLTKNELRILEVLMRRQGRIATRDEIMQELWNTDSFVDDNTLTVNMNRLRRTLSKLGLTDYVVTHRGQGYSA